MFEQIEEEKTGFIKSFKESVIKFLLPQYEGAHGANGNCYPATAENPLLLLFLGLVLRVFYIFIYIIVRLQNLALRMASMVLSGIINVLMYFFRTANPDKVNMSHQNPIDKSNFRLL